MATSASAQALSSPPVRGDHFLQVLVAWMKEPSSIAVLRQQASFLKPGYAANNALSMLHNTCRELSRKNLDAELKVLTRQGVGRTTGTVAMMQAIGVVAKSTSSGAEPELQGTSRKRKSSGAEPQGSNCKRNSLEAEPRGSNCKRNSLEAEPQVSQKRAGTVVLGLQQTQFDLIRSVDVLEPLLHQCRKLSLPHIKHINDIQVWTAAFDAFLWSLPPECKMQGTYVGPHVRRKMLLAALKGLLGPNMKVHKEVNLDALTARVAMRLSGPDQNGMGNRMPAVMRAGRLSRILGTQPELIGMHACLWKDACTGLPDCIKFLELHAESLPAILQQYIAKHSVTPSPFLLVQAAMESLSWQPIPLPAPPALIAQPAQPAEPAQPAQAPGSGRRRVSQKTGPT